MFLWSAEGPGPDSELFYCFFISSFSVVCYNYSFLQLTSSMLESDTCAYVTFSSRIYFKYFSSLMINWLNVHSDWSWGEIRTLQLMFNQLEQLSLGPTSPLPGGFSFFRRAQLRANSQPLASRPLNSARISKMSFTNPLGHSRESDAAKIAPLSTLEVGVSFHSKDTYSMTKREKKGPTKPRLQQNSPLCQRVGHVRTHC